MSSPHRRLNPLTGEWVLVSPHRTARPWQGARESQQAAAEPYEPQCYLCPGNTRANGETNPDYHSCFTFQNDFSALLSESSEPSVSEGLFQSVPATGECRVVCYHPRHDLTMAGMSQEQILAVVQEWIAQTKDLGARYKWVQVFENKGAAMGASNPHPHGQVWACDYLPTLPAKEDLMQREYFSQHKKALLLDYAEQELALGERVVLHNEHWVWLVPFWATWPFETLLLPRTLVPRLTDLNASQQSSLAAILGEGLRTYDALFDTSFPYSMGWHGAPFGGSETGWQVHAHFYPPLLRSADIRKFMVGFELLSESQRDLTPESAAALLRDLSAKITS